MENNSKRTVSVNWLDDCPICGHGQAAVTTRGYTETLWSGDQVTCMKCGNNGEIDADGENAWVEWDAQEEAKL